MTARVLVTGATGFVGNTLCDVLAQAGYLVRAALRGEGPVPAGVAETAIVGDIGTATHWTDALHGVDFVVHLAARAHILGDAPANAGLYMETNACGTERLAEASTHAGVQRFVYLSSVKVNGEGGSNKPYTAADAPRPQDAYGESKRMAEECLTEIAARTGLEMVIVRPPLVYGPGVRANFLRLLVWVDRQWPIPLGAVDNERSLVSVWNLCDVLLQVLDNPAAPGRTWMVSDGRDVSTADLMLSIGAAMNRRVRLWPVPVAMLRWGGALLGREAEVARLCGSLTVDMTPTCQHLGWSPPLTLEQGLARTVRWYLDKKASRAG